MQSAGRVWEGCYFAVQGVRQGVMLLLQLPLAWVTFPDGDLTGHPVLIAYKQN